MKLKFKNVPSDFGKTNRSSLKASPFKQTNTRSKSKLQEQTSEVRSNLSNAWSSIKENASEIGHTALDIGGMIPGIGAGADALNASWYASKGDTANAALSSLALVPGAGQFVTGTKLMSKARRLFGLGDKVADVSKATAKVVDDKVAKFKMNDEQLSNVFQMHGAESQMVKQANGKVVDVGAHNYWRKPVKNSNGEAVIKRNGKPFTQEDVAQQKLFGAADDINNAEKGAMQFKYKGTESGRDVMQMSVIRNGKKKDISMIRSTSGGNKTLDWVNPATGKKHKVGSRGINYPAMDKSVVIKDGKKTGAAHWYKNEGWETGYGIEDFEKLGKGNFVPSRNANGSFQYTKNGALDGSWTGGQIGDELIKQTVKIID